MLHHHVVAGGRGREQTITMGRLTERQQLKKLQEEAAAASNKEEEVQAILEEEEIPKRRNPSRTTKKETATSSQADNDDMDDVFNVDDSDDEEEDEPVVSKTRKRLQRGRTKKRKAQHADEKEESNKEQEEASATKPGMIPRLKKKKLENPEEGSKSDMTLISKSLQQQQPIMAVKPPVVPKPSAPKPTDQQQTSKNRPSTNRAANNAPPPRESPRPQVDLTGNASQPPVKQAPAVKEETKVIEPNYKLLEKLVSDVMKDVPRMESKTRAIDLSGSFLYDEESRYDFYDVNDKDEIVIQPPLPMFPEDFAPGKKEWPLSWWGIVDPMLAPKSNTPKPDAAAPGYEMDWQNEDWQNRPQGPPPPHFREAWQRNVPPHAQQQQPPWPHHGRMDGGSMRGGPDPRGWDDRGRRGGEGPPPPGWNSGPRTDGRRPDYPPGHRGPRG